MAKLIKERLEDYSYLDSYYLEDEFFEQKVKFLKDRGYDIDEDTLDEIQAVEVSPSDWKYADKGMTYIKD